MTLNDNTMVRNPDTGEAVSLLRGDDVPDWADGLLGDHLFGGSIPPKAGKGSGREAWAEYAGDNGLVVDSEMNRDDVVAACEAAGIPTQ